MKKHEIIQKMIEKKLVAVIRATSADEAFRLVQAVEAGGIYFIEITFTVPRADEIIKELCKTYKGDAATVIIGAGTVLDSITARIAILNGANFIVSPTFDEETAKLCNRYSVPYLPGCMTITEMVKALEYGVDIIKLFPGSAFGPSFIKDVHGPLPHVQIMPTGGVDLENIADWLKSGAIAIGIGSKLTAPGKSGDYHKVINLAKEYVASVQQFLDSEA